MCKLKYFLKFAKDLKFISHHPTQWVVKVSELLAPFLAEALLGGSGFLGGARFLVRFTFFVNFGCP